MITHASRLRVAEHLLNTASDLLHVTARKIKLLFLEALQYVVRTNGCVGMQLYTLMRLVCDTWRADTQEVEGFMSLIQAAVSKAPSIGLPQLDARVGNAVDLQFGWKSSKRPKWSIMEPYLNALVDDAAQHVEASKNLMHLGWFTVPHPTTRPILRVAAQPLAMSEKCRLWSAARTDPLFVTFGIEFAASTRFGQQI